MDNLTLWFQIRQNTDKRLNISRNLTLLNVPSGTFLKPVRAGKLSRVFVVFFCGI